jgi:hypothetical protein
MVGDVFGIGCTCADFCAHATSARSAMRLTARRWAMEIRPERGGRIVSLRLDGEELLDQGIGVDQPTADGFVEGGAFGWDEMVPNLEPTDSLPDHGEAWRLPWEVIGEGVMRCTGRLVPWELERSIELDDAVRVSYVYRNAGDTPHRLFWCAHPLFKLEAEMDAGIPLPGEGSSRKDFLPRGSVERFGLRWPSGRGIEMSWDVDLTPDLAIWLCNGDLGGYRQIAIEPETSSLMLGPGATYAWWLRIDAL